MENTQPGSCTEESWAKLDQLPSQTCDEGFGESSLGPPESAGENIAWPSVVCRPGSRNCSYLYAAENLLPSRQ